MIKDESKFYVLPFFRGLHAFISRDDCSEVDFCSGVKIVNLLLASESEVDFFDQGNQSIRPGAELFSRLSDALN